MGVYVCVYVYVYDMCVNPSSAMASVYDEVEIEDMAWDEDKQTFFYPCTSPSAVHTSLGQGYHLLRRPAELTLRCFGGFLLTRLDRSVWRQVFHHLRRPAGRRGYRHLPQLLSYYPCYLRFG